MKFELSDEDNPDNVLLARKIFERGNTALRSSSDKESRALLLEAWKDFEKEKGDEDSVSKIMEKMPRRIKRRRRVVGEDGVSKKQKTMRTNLKSKLNNFFHHFLE